LPRLRLTGLVLGATCLACTDPRSRPVPPELVVQFTATTVTSPDTLFGSLYAQDSDGLRELILALRSSDGTIRIDSSQFVAGAFELSRNLRFAIPAGLAPGGQLLVVARVSDAAGFATSDSTFLSIQ
jgi:hypothetical protein